MRFSAKRLSLLAALTGAVTVAAATPAAATVRITSTAITVTAPGGASAIVQRSPFALSFLDRRGDALLREAPAGQPLAVIPPVAQSEFGRPSPPPPALYGPLSFIVGTEQIGQVPDGNYVGNLTSVTTGGIAYHADSVLSATPDGNGVKLVLSTTDPTGRHLNVQLAPQGGALRLRAQADPADGVATVADSFPTPSDEAFHGFGGRHNSLDQRGDEFYNWLQQENVSSGSADGLTAPTSGSNFLFPNGPEAAYYVQSAFVSSRGYAFLLDSDALSHWRMASDDPGLWQTEAGAGSLAYDVVPAGGVAAAVAGLNRLTGRQPAPPRWAVGTQFDREARFPSDPESQYVSEVESDIANFDRYHVHVDGYRVEAWQFLPPAVLRHIVNQLQARHIHPLVYFRPFVDASTSGLDDPGEYGFAVSHGYVATHADGSPYEFVDNYNQQGALIDFTNPAAVRWWQQRIRRALNAGADGFMQDFGEQVQADMHFHDGETGVTMHNRYPVLYHRVTRQVFTAFVHQYAHRRRQLFYYTRAGYSGTPGSSAYEGANFAGDETTDWARSAGLASLATDMLNRAIGGAFGYTTDIGGYWDLGPYSPTTRELFIRWAEWAALSPFFRLHGSLSAGTHTPWSYDAQTVGIYKSLGALHARLVPLILRLWRTADRTGMPVTRPLWLAYPSDLAAASQDQEWMLGSDVLAAPVVEQGATTRTAYLPSGCWRYLGRGPRLHGGHPVTVSAPLAVAVYFVRCGRRIG